VVVRLIIAAGDEPATTRSFAKGATGEQIVGRTLDSISSGKGVVAIHDRRVPRSLANIDHIAVTPSGIFVIDTKHYEGQRVSKGFLGSLLNPGPPQLFVGRHNCTHLVKKMPAQRNVVAAALEGLPEAANVPILPMIVFVNADWGFLARPIDIDGVWVGSPRQMAKAVSAYGPLDAAAKERLVERVAARLRPA
jgi:hypothetical protein